jgi:KipI family sensor histidine kinase inhibitor
MGDSAWRFELPAGTDPASVLQTLRSVPRVIDAVVADGYGLIRFLPEHPPLGLEAALQHVAPLPASSHRRHVISVRYDGPDLDEVAKTAGLDRDDVIRLHSGRVYTVQMVGFLPGFAYLGPVDAALALPRRPSPRLRVPAGAVAVAAGRTAIYPLSSPGGWHLIGSALSFVGFDPKTGATLQLGDSVRFEPVT